MTADARAAIGGAVAMVRSVALTIAIGALVLAGCGPHGVEGAPIDAAMADAIECADGETTCGGRCVDTGWDPLHCGACGVTCSGETSSCGAGRCMASGATIWGASLRRRPRQVGGDRSRRQRVHRRGVPRHDRPGRRTTHERGRRRPRDRELLAEGRASLVEAHRRRRRGARRRPRGGRYGRRGEVSLGELVYVVGGYVQTVDLGGGVETSVGMTDAFLLALSADDGSYRASSSFGTAGDDYAVGVVGDAEGNVTIGGTFATGTLALGGGHALMGTAGGNAFLASFGSDGGHRWSRTIAGGGGTGVSNQIHSLAIDREGNVTAGGEFWGFAEFGGAVPNPTLVTGDAFVASYDASGSPRWGRTFGSPGTERTLGVAANPAGDIVAGGSFDGTVDFGGTTLTSTGFGLGDGWLAILDGGDGDTRLARAIDGELTTAVRDVAAGADASASIAADVQGALDLGAGPVPPRGRITLARLDPTTGAPRFAARYGGGPSDAAWSVAVGRHGATAAAGMVSRNADLGLGPIVGAQAQYGFVMMLAP